jgi:ABC-type phosphate/phosphonate transport system substrate-binding protein
VPFIVAFVNEKLPEATRTDIQKALLGIAKEKDLLTAMETKDGFVELPAKKK